MSRVSGNWSRTTARVTEGLRQPEAEELNVADRYSLRRMRSARAVTGTWVADSQEKDSSP
jgi:hypothetical protein